jgi:iron complex outermembrane recepter protein
MKRVTAVLLVCVSIVWNTYAQWNLSINVRNKDGESIHDAIVALQGTFGQKITDQNGTCNFTNLPGGSYSLSVSHLGYQQNNQVIVLDKNLELNVLLTETSIVTEDVVIKGVRADDNQPVTFSLVTKEDIEKQNVGHDVPYLLSMEPSVVTTSDAGAGIGYTSMRIRGLDAEKVNVTINGIPYNDAESHGVYWVDIADIASSVRSIQIQRGLGKSSNGPGAFGASINLETNAVPLNPYVKLDNSIGSYQSIKNTVQAGTGLLNHHWFAEGKFSRVNSNGYIDRATSALRSYFAQAGYYSDKSLFRIITFGGFEETYQAWYGIDSAGINTLGRRYNYAGYYERDGISSFYNKEVDHYNQDHVQVNYAHLFNQNLSFNTIFNYTNGRGYYQEYQDNAAFADYLLDNVSGADTSDLVDRKWLRNNLFAGNTFLSWSSNHFQITYGIGFSSYAHAKHYGEILWSEIPNPEVDGRQFYSNEGNKTDLNTYLKLNYQFSGEGNLYVDLNYRHINYKASGTDRESGDEVVLNLNKNYSFFNPIVGVSYSLPIGLLYTTFGTSHREPTRSDFINNYSQLGSLKPETMYNTEIGIRKKFSDFFYELNFYYMLYRNELIKTGQLDDVGSPILKNTGKSFRSGIEMSAGVNVASFLTLKANLSLSRSRTDFKDYIDSTWITRSNVAISYSPDVIAGGELIAKPMNGMEISLANKYVSKQYLDNTQDERRKLDGYFVSNLHINLKKNFGFLKDAELKLMVNNIFNVRYNSNGYMYEDIPYYFPQATRNYMAGLTIGF